MSRVLLLVLLAAGAVFAQEASDASESDPDHIAKLSDDVLWHLQLGDIAKVGTFRYTGLPRTAKGSQPMILFSYSFIPKNLDPKKKYPLAVLVHGGVHSNFMTGGPANAATIVREFLERGYVVAAPDYRGSTGYGAVYKAAIDYGGKENDDVLGARNWMLETYSFLDASRTAVVGWSHGGMIALMNIFQHPEAWTCAYASNPVSDLIIRKSYLKTMPQTIAESAGDDAAKDDAEYKKRSPVTYAASLRKPLLLHAATNDQTVRYPEIESLMQALQSSNRKFESKIYKDAPGGHHFNRIDTKLARESRDEMYQFLAKYLHP